MNIIDKLLERLKSSAYDDSESLSDDDLIAKILGDVKDLCQEENPENLEE